MATTAAGRSAKQASGSTAERVARLRETAEHDPAIAQDAAWMWFERLGASAAHDREAAANELEALFACGRPSSGLDGPTEGILVAPLIQRGVDAAARTITSLWMPWMGKSFDAGAQTGTNRLVGSARWASKLLWPLYSTRAGDGSRLAFDFETRIEPGAIEPSPDVLVIDYAPVEANPRLVIRRIRDELVEIVPGAHLGRILYRQGDDGYSNIGYFALRNPVS
jgi:hypothetical protein